ncbi:hypothetical protein SporoP37_04050 [Sporosarcina sp. P37]|uniref:M24 family metallopeptidase n=1 Tax=unclassified Sporosarcina TaxID=2647733 RepID=UPI000A17E7C1|nr:MULTISPECIES: M24 family metallopeptidase [unclassified Sporosarcina]ARK23953.1 hypothetical protein SporoP37_04050 [Sporosarcina sp. P37]PID17268.1 aminopeptidase P family protein [Sporosarcina sp. P35]
MFANNIPVEDFANRIAYCQQEAAARGLSGLMVWSRGGGAFDRYADVDYLANYYQQRCYLPDNPPFWSGRSHCVLLIPPTSAPVLLVSSPEYQEHLITVKDVRFSPDLPRLCFETLKELGMADGNIGLIGGDVLPYSLSTRLNEYLPELTLTPMDFLLSTIRSVKTEREQESIREAARIGSKAMDILMRNVSADKTESEVIAPAIEYIISQGAVLYFVVTNSGSKAYFAHSSDFPGYDHVNKLENGDLFKVDLIIAYEGYLSDFGRTTVVGGEATAIQRDMLNLVTAACEHVIKQIEPGRLVKNLCQSGDQFLLDHGVGFSSVQTDPNVTYAAYPPHWGHGLGMTWEQPYFTSEEEVIIQAGMCIAIEKALYRQDVGTVFFEQNLLVTETGIELLTTTEKIWI